MKAAVHRRYGSAETVEIVDAEKPAPGPDEVLIRIRAASVNPLDSHFLHGRPAIGRLFLGLKQPKDPRIGRDFAGVIESTGEEVFGVCRGSFAEYAVAAKNKFAKKPRNATFEEAATLGIAAVTALHIVRKFVRSGQRVLITGATGGVGSFAVQIAKAAGAYVTGVCGPSNVAAVRSLGATRAIDYTREDFTRGTEQYDVIIDCFATHSFREIRNVLRDKGTYILVGGPLSSAIAFLTNVLGGLLSNIARSRKFRLAMVKVTPAALAELASLVEAGKVKPLIDRRFALRDTAQAIEYLETHHARGKVVIIPE